MSKRIEKTVKVTCDIRRARSMLTISGFNVKELSDDEVLYKVLDLLMDYGTDWIVEE